MRATATATASTHEQQVLRLARKRNLLRAHDVTQHGLPTIALTRLVQAGKLDRVARGLFGLPGAKISEHRSLAEFTLDDLWRHATRGRVANVMRPYIEAITA
jgi:hypothetical protein